MKKHPLPFSIKIIPILILVIFSYIKVIANNDLTCSIQSVSLSTNCIAQTGTYDLKVIVHHNISYGTNICVNTPSHGNNSPIQCTTIYTQQRDKKSTFHFTIPSDNLTDVPVEIYADCGGNEYYYETYDEPDCPLACNINNLSITADNCNPNDGTYDATVAIDFDLFGGGEFSIDFLRNNQSIRSFTAVAGSGSTAYTYPFNNISSAAKDVTVRLAIDGEICEVPKIEAVNYSEGFCLPCNYHDSLALVQFYYSLGGDNWDNNSGWLTEQPIQSWKGVAISEDGCKVKGIQLTNNNLTGNLATIRDIALPNLEYLYLNSNNLAGAIPNFTQLNQLKDLWIGQNNLVSTIPNFSNLPNLQRFTASFNQLSGNIPNFSNLPRLTDLNLGNNKLSGTIPNFSSVRQLYRLFLNNNLLTGAIPNFSNVPRLNQLILNDNQLSGTIPNFSNLGSLINFVAENNQLSGSIPSFNQLTNLIGLNLGHNNLTGSIPNLSGLRRLSEMKFQSNQLSGVIPNLDPLSRLYVQDNQFNFTDIGTHIATNGNNSNIYRYTPQSEIPIEQKSEKLSVEAGRNIADNTYRWYRNNELVATISGDHTYAPTLSGNYHAEVSNTNVTRTGSYQNLVLKSKLIYFVPPLHFRADDYCGYPDDLIEIPIIAEHFTTIADFQFAVHLPSNTTFHDVIPAALSFQQDAGGDGYSYNINGNILRFGWDKTGGETLTNGTTIFSIVVRLSGPPNSQGILRIGDAQGIDAMASLWDEFVTPIDLEFSESKVCIFNHFNFSGDVTTYYGIPMKNVQIINANNSNSITQTNSVGHYIFHPEAGSNFNLTASKNNDPLNGIDNDDLEEIKKQARSFGGYFLDKYGSEEALYRFLAADVDGNRKVTIRDRTILKMAIASGAFNDGISWRFLLPEHELELCAMRNNAPIDECDEDTQEEQVKAYPNQRDYSNIDQHFLQQNFIGIKRGDVNQSANLDE